MGRLPSRREHAYPRGDRNGKDLRGLDGSGAGVAARLSGRTRRREQAPPLRVLWITPLRALAGDTEAALRAPIEDFGLPWTVESRTGDTPARVRARQRQRLPTALVTTPESLSLLLAREDALSLFDHLELVVVDEWHELMASKRGVQTELGPCPPPQVPPGPSDHRPLGDARQSRDRPRRNGRYGAGRPPECREHHPRTDSQGPRGGRAHSGHDRALSMGRADRAAPAPRGHCRDRGRRDLPCLHEYASDRGDLVSGDPGRPPRLGRHHGPPSRVPRPFDTRMGGGWPSRGAPALCGLHVDARSRRGFHAGRSGASGGESQGGGPAHSARGAERSPTGRGEPADVRAHQRARSGGHRRGARLR